ncbi:MAG TPA: stage II sporulation protein E [Clostridia bacterium]|nr:stage II sporulation protein E [Clostridia bacterium]
MQNINILPYKRIIKEQLEDKNQKNLYKNLEQIIFLSILGFFIGRAIIFNTLLPFGIAFFATLLRYKKRYFLIGLPVWLGILTLHNVNSFKYLLAIIFIFLLEGFLKVKPSNVIKVSLITFFSLFVSGVIFSYSYGFLLFDIMMSLYESLTAMLMVFIFNHSISFVININRKIISNEELISLSILLGLFVLGLNHLVVWKFTFSGVLGIFIILLAAYIGGAGVGSGIGTTIGVLSSLSLVQMPTSIGLFGFAGLLSGSLKKLNRFGVIAGFLVAIFIIAFYVTLNVEMLINPYDIVLASLMFAAIPKKYIGKAEELLNKNKNLNNRNYNEKLKEVVTGKLKEYSQVFEELSKSFKQVNEKVLDHKDISYLFEEIANKTCTECVMYKTCWDKEFYNTYKSMFELIEHLEKNSSIEDNKLYRKCIRFSELMSITKYYLGIYKISMQWRERLKDAKGLIAAQLKGVADAISNMASDISMNVTFKDELEQVMMVELDKKGIPVEDVLIYDIGDGNINVKIYKKACYSAKECDKKIIPIVSEIMGERYERKNRLCSIDYNGRCVITLTKAESLQVSTGISRISKSKTKISGDTYSFMDLEGGKYMAALSDGMGFGYKAAEESGVTISLLEKFIEAGFDKHLVIQTLNSILALRSAEEMFSTVDIMFLDKYTGEAEFIKIGSCATFLKRGNEVEIIQSSSLPIGILEDIEADIHERKLKDGDFVILVTDGVLECFEKDKEINFSRIIKEVNTRSPQDMSEMLMKKCLEFCDNTPKDDMTILVSKIWRKI